MIEIRYAITANVKLGKLVVYADASPMTVNMPANIRASLGLISPRGIGRFGSLIASILRS